MNRRENLLMLTDLTAREQQILRLLVMGYSNRQLAEKLYISISTVKAHMQQILSTLKVDNRVQAAIVAAYIFGVSPEEIVKNSKRSRRG